MTAQVTLTMPAMATVGDLKDRILEEMPGLEDEAVCFLVPPPFAFILFWSGPLTNLVRRTTWT